MKYKRKKKHIKKLKKIQLKKPEMNTGDGRYTAMKAVATAM